jgi:histidinol dehydrogenase
LIIDVNSAKDIETLKLDERAFDLQQKEDAVKKIIEDVKTLKDKALFSYTKQFDNFDVNKENVKVSKKEFDDAINSIPQNEKKIIQYAKERIEKFHTEAKQKSFLTEENGIILGNRITPCKSCGLYVPGGKAAYPSTALMTIIPAKVAGVDNIYIATPSQNGIANRYVLYAAHLCGVENVYKIGGAQAVAAFAYSTESINKVDVVAGPGNIYVALAKKLVFGDVSIDSIAGPSEIMIVADKSADADFAAHDLLSQAEHDEMAGCYFVGLDRELAENVEKRFFSLANTAKRNNITAISSKNAKFFYTDSLSIAALLVDEIAPEHLELQLNEPYGFMNMFRNAGAIFIGHYTPEPIGDYIAGPNHTLPTNHTAKYASPLSCDVFMKKSSIIHYSKEAFFKTAKYASEFASLEGLFAHKDSIEVRFDKD